MLCFIWMHITDMVDIVACWSTKTACLQIACWGNGDQGRLGLGSAGGSSVPCLVGALTDALYTGVSCGGAHTAAVAQDGSAYLWGLNDRGQLAQGDETPFLQVSSLSIL